MPVVLYALIGVELANARVLNQGDEVDKVEYEQHKTHRHKEITYGIVLFLQVYVCNVTIL